MTVAILWLGVLSLVLTTELGAQTRWYVDANNPSPGNGASWATARTDLKTLLDQVSSPAEIWVADGLYLASASGDPGDSFVLKNGVALYGGFDGGESDLGQRDWATFPAILSGDLRDDDGDGVPPDTEEWNSVHVVEASFVDPSAILDGFVVQQGVARTEGTNNGGGLRVHNESAPTVRNCTFRWNRAARSGGAIYSEKSAPLFDHCVFDQNVCQFDGGAAAMQEPSTELTETPEFRDCRFFNNTATIGSSSGGAVAVTNGAHADFIQCVFWNNSAIYGGGGLCVRHSDSTATLMACTVAQNVVVGGVGGGGILLEFSGAATLSSSIVANNTSNSSQIHSNSAGPPTVSYSCVEGQSFPGTGNISSDPGFVTSAGDLGSSSPCIDRGDSGPLEAFGILLDVLDRPRYVDDASMPNQGTGSFPYVDMGAYEFCPCPPESLPPTPELRAVDPLVPAFGSPGCSRYVSVFGQGFAPDCIVQVDGEDILATNWQADGQVDFWTPNDLTLGGHDVRIVNPGGVCPDQISETASYLVAHPEILDLSPTSVLDGSSVPVTVTGTGFVAPVLVVFTDPGSGARIEAPASGSETEVTLMSPSLTPGCYDVTIVTGDQTACPDESAPATDQFCSLQPPDLIQVSPAQGATCGDSIVTLTGTEFGSSPTVIFGSEEASNLAVDPLGTWVIVRVTPQPEEGLVDVQLQTGAGSDTLPQAFLFKRLSPKIDLISPDIGSFAGGTSITIVGNHFCEGSSVSIGGRSATGVVYDAENGWITAVTPFRLFDDCTQTDYPVTVTVRNPDNGVGTGVFTYSRDAGQLLFVDNTVCSGSEPPWDQKFTTIQEAIDAAVDGDVVLIEPCSLFGGHYSESLLVDKRIVLASSDPQERPTIIFTGGTGRTFVLTVKADAVIGCLELLSGSDGGVSIEGSPSLISNAIHDCGANGVDNDGAGVRVISGAPRLIGNSIRNNSARNGGGLAVLTGARATLIGNEISGNGATGHGGGVFLQSGHGPFRMLPGATGSLDQTILENNCTGRGGGIYDGGGSESELSETVIASVLIHGNEALGIGGIGGGVHIDPYCQLTIRNSAVTMNKSHGVVQSGIYGDVQFAESPAVGGGGFSILTASGSTNNIKIESVLIGDNQALGPCSFGGGLCMVSPQDGRSFLELDGCEVYRNSSQAGGGLAIGWKVVASIRETVICGNQAVPSVDDMGMPTLCAWQDSEDISGDSLAPGVWVSDCEVYFQNNTVHGNLASDGLPGDGGGLFGAAPISERSEIWNSLFSKNSGFGVSLSGVSINGPFQVCFGFNDFWENQVGQALMVDPWNEKSSFERNPHYLTMDCPGGFELSPVAPVSPAIDSGAVDCDDPTYDPEDGIDRGARESSKAGLPGSGGGGTSSVGGSKK